MTSARVVMATILRFHPRSRSPSFLSLIPLTDRRVRIPTVSSSFLFPAPHHFLRHFSQEVPQYNCQF